MHDLRHISGFGKNLVYSRLKQLDEGEGREHEREQNERLRPINPRFFQEFVLEKIREVEEERLDIDRAANHAEAG